MKKKFPTPERVEPGMIVKDDGRIFNGKHRINSLSANGKMAFSGGNYIACVENILKFSDFIGVQLPDGRSVMVGERRRNQFYEYDVIGVFSGSSVIIDRGEYAPRAWNADHVLCHELVRATSESVRATATAASDLTLFDANGSDLDKIGARYGVRRHPLMGDCEYRDRLFIADYRRNLDAILAKDLAPFAAARAAAMRNGVPDKSAMSDSGIAGVLAGLVAYEDARGGSRYPAPGAIEAMRRVSHVPEAVVSAYERARGPVGSGPRSPKGG